MGEIISDTWNPLGNRQGPSPEVIIEGLTIAGFLEGVRQCGKED